MKPKILIVEHDSANIKLIHDELEKGKVNFTSEIVHTRKEYKKALLNFKPDIILSHYTFPSFDGPAAFKIKNKLSPETPYFFVSDSIGEDTAIEWIKNGVSDFVLKGNLSSLTSKMNRALKSVKISKLLNAKQQVDGKRIEELSYNVQKYYSVIDSSMDAILITLKNGIILEANTSACEIFQMTREEICNSTQSDLIDISDHRLQLFLEERELTGRARGELRFKRKDGSWISGEISSVVFIDANGQEKMSLTIKNISERKLAEDKQLLTSNALQEALNERNKILDSSLDIICSFDMEGRFVSASAAAKTIWGYSPEELLGKNHIDLVFPKDRKSTRAIDAKIKTGVPVTMFENRFLHKNGNVVPMLWSCRWDERDKLNYAVAKDATEKKSLEKAFHVERERFLALFSQAPESMGILKGPDYIFEMANLPYLELIGRKNIIGKTVKEVLPEITNQGFFDILDTVFQTGETYTAHETLVKLDVDGNGILVDKYLNFIYQAYRNNLGAIDGVFFFAVDVTDKVLSSKKIEESENRFRVLIEKSDQMIFLATKDGEIIYNSPSIRKIFGFRPEETLHKFKRDFIHPEDIGAYERKRIKILEIPGASFYHQQRMLNKNGDWIWCESIVTNMLEERGVHAMVANFRDITEKKLREQQREFDRKNLDALINNTNDLMWSVNKEYNLITSNTPFDTMVQSTQGKTILKGSNILTGLTLEQKKVFKVFYERAFKGETFTEVVKTQIPFEMWSEISYYPILKGDEIIGTACHSRNITGQKQNELRLENLNTELAFQIEEKLNRAAELIITNNELLKTNSELDRFVYSVSHDLRSPLTSILGVLSFIEEESQEPDTLEHAEMIHKSINRLDEFIKNILSYSRNNRTALEVEIISPQQTAIEIVDALQDIKEADGIHFEIEISEQQAFYSDKIRFNTIFENLISNAIKYHQKDQLDRYIKISGHSDQDKLQLSVSDNGIGIAKRYHEKIFDMFFRLSGETDGSGIGLYIVKNTIKILQGTITIESEEGKGTTFHIILKNLKP